MNEITLRIRKIFNALEKSQTEFARAINVTPAYVWKLLNKDDSAPSDRLIVDICEKFNVNEDWLRRGTGGDDNMFVPEDMLYLQNVGKLGKEKNAFKKFYLNTMMKLPDEYWDYIYDEFRKFEKKQGE